MKKKYLGYYNSAFMGATLFITLYLMNQFPGTHVFYFAEIYIAVNTVKDVVMHKLGYTFRGFGIKKMIILDLIILLYFIIFHISVID